MRAAWRTCRSWKRSATTRRSIRAERWPIPLADLASVLARRHELLEFLPAALWQARRGAGLHCPAGWARPGRQSAPLLLLARSREPGAVGAGYPARDRRGGAVAARDCAAASRRAAPVEGRRTPGPG